MDYILVGKIVNTHGIKGEIRILSSFMHKKVVFNPNFSIYIGEEKEEHIINSYRVHKNFDMITLKGIDNINDVLKYKGKKVYVKRNDLGDIILNEDLINFDCYTKTYIGKVKDIVSNNKQDILVIENDGKKTLIPKVDDFIEKIDLEKKIIYINEIRGLIDED